VLADGPTSYHVAAALREAIRSTVSPGA